MDWVEFGFVLRPFTVCLFNAHMHAFLLVIYPEKLLGISGKIMPRDGTLRFAYTMGCYRAFIKTTLTFPTVGISSKKTSLSEKSQTQKTS